MSPSRSNGTLPVAEYIACDVKSSWIAASSKPSVIPSLPTALALLFHSSNEFLNAVCFPPANLSANLSIISLPPPAVSSNIAAVVPMVSAI